MTTISPLLQNRINNKSANADRYYESLVRNANNTLLPNESKAKLVNENFFQAGVSNVIDTGKDCVNFAKVLKTGEISDNNLGRLNGLGMKLGAGLIAAFLAVHSKTKTDAAMKLLGGATFLASMNLWPKIFIQTPMKLLHGVDINKKYVNAQGDKKEFFLDNQFIPWDITDVKSEKEQRRQSKAALQGRALVLATAGFATPLTASLVGNALEPKVYESIVKHDVKKASTILNSTESLAQHLEGAKVPVKNEKAISQLFESYKSENKALDNDFFKKLSGLLNITDIEELFSDSDSVNPLKDVRNSNLASELQKLYKTQAEVDVDSLKEALKGTILSGKIDANNPVELLYTPKELAQMASEGKLGSVITTEEIDKIASQLKDKTPSEVKKVLADNGLSQKQIENILPKVKVNSDKFFETIKNYNKEVLPELRGKLKAYLEVLNPIAGAKRESFTTKEYNDTMASLMKELGVDYRTLKTVNGKLVEDCVPIVSDLFAQKVKGVEYGSDAYKELVKTLTKGSTPEELTDLIKELSKDESLQLISSKNGMKELNEAVLGTNQTSGIANIIKKFLSVKELDLSATKIKPAICLNYEIRKASGEFAQKGFSPAEIKAMDTLVYNGNSAFRENLGYMHNAKRYNDIVNTVFDENMFKSELSVMPELKNILNKLKNYAKAEVNPTLNDKYFATGSLTGLFKNTATNLYNNKSWLRKFGGMAIILSVATLLIQPFFGNIKKEYPEAGQKGQGVK